MDNFSQENHSNKKQGFFYFDEKNENLWVVKPGSWFGKVLNFGNPLAYIVVILVILFFVLLVRLV